MQGAGRRRIYLMRHGHVDYFQAGMTDFDNVTLTPAGVEQARAAGEGLKSIKFDIALCSGLERTVETAGLVLAANDQAPILNVEPRLRELRGGTVEATSREEVAAHLAYSFEDAMAPGASFLPGGELFADAQERIAEAMVNIVTEGDWRTALIVAHEGVNRIALGWASGGGLATVSAFEQDLGCINILDLDITPNPAGDGLQVERVLIKALNVTAYDYVKRDLARTSLEHLFEIDFGGVRPARPVS